MPAFNKSGQCRVDIGKTFGKLEKHKGLRLRKKGNE